MPGPIVVGYEDTAQGRDALELGVLLASLLGGRLLVALVYTHEPRLYQGSDEIHGDLLGQAGRTLGQAIDGLSLPRGVKIDVVPLESPPPARGLHAAHALKDLAARDEAQILVVGSCRRGPIGRVLIGSVAERLLHGAGCPVAVAPRGYGDQARLAPATVAVAYDGSEESDLALAEGAALARAAGADLRLINVLEPWEHGRATMVPGRSESVLEAVERRHERVLDSALAAIQESPIAEAKLLRGHADEVLVAQSKTDVDLLVIGSRGYGPLGCALLGGVSSGVVRAAACPIVVVPRPLDARPLSAP